MHSDGKKRRSFLALLFAAVICDVMPQGTPMSDRPSISAELHVAAVENL
jgi:hypothetical protein